VVNSDTVRLTLDEYWEADVSTITSQVDCYANQKKGIIYHLRGSVPAVALTECSKVSGRDEEDRQHRAAVCQKEGGEGHAPTRTDGINRSSIGDWWILIQDDETDRRVVRDEPSVALGQRAPSRENAGLRALQERL
jgi:hypothetical protein